MRGLLVVGSTNQRVMVCPCQCPCKSGEFDVLIHELNNNHVSVRQSGVANRLSEKRIGRERIAFY
jgi:hypothetical protein